MRTPRASGSIDTYIFTWFYIMRVAPAFAARRPAEKGSTMTARPREAAPAGGPPITRHSRRLPWAVAALLVAALVAAAFSVWNGGDADASETDDVGSSQLPDGVDRLEGFAEGTTGGADGETVTAADQSELEDYLSAEEPYVILVDGAIEVSPKGTEMDIASNKSVVGVGTGGEIVGGGFFLGEDTSNVIIRNLTIRDTEMPEDDPDDKDFDYDGIQMDGASDVWIDHNRIARMNDGLVDSRKDTTNLTVSWNEIGEGNKAFGIGWTDNVTAEITIHHNWIHDTGPRNPSTDNVAHAHLYNNYLQNIDGYGNYSRGYTKMVIENSYFENVTDPYYPDETAELVESGSVCVDCSGRQETSGSAFDPGEFYDYTLHPAEDLPAMLDEYAGPQDWIEG